MSICESDQSISEVEPVLSGITTEVSRCEIVIFNCIQANIICICGIA